MQTPTFNSLANAEGEYFVRFVTLAHRNWGGEDIQATFEELLAQRTERAILARTGKIYGAGSHGKAHRAFLDFLVRYLLDRQDVRHDDLWYAEQEPLEQDDLILVIK
jgi:hypothetical protein